MAMSAAMVAASHGRTVSSGARNHWEERASALLSTLLYAAAIGGADVSDVLQWADRHHGVEALDLLARDPGQHHPSTALLTGILATDPREQSGIWSTTSGVLSAYRSLGALDATQGDQLDATEFVAGSHTLHVCSSARNQALVAPLVVGLLTEIQQAAYQRNNPDRPVLFALDELANIAPLPELPQLVSEGGGQGLLTIGCLQDLSQARSRWGSSADGFLSLFSTTLVLGGIADIPTLRALRDLSGHHEVIRSTVTEGRDVRQRPTNSVSLSHQREERLTLSSIASGNPGSALLLDARNHLDFISLTTAHRDEPWRSLIEPAVRSLPGLDR